MSTEYALKIIFNQREISDKEKADRLKRFQDAFVTAAVDYYSEKMKKSQYYH